MLCFVTIYADLDVKLKDIQRLSIWLKSRSLSLLVNCLLYVSNPVIKNRISVVIAGAPNVGKSTLLNALLQEERAIISPIAGTTRDTIEGQMHLEGLLFRFIDTAGLRKNVSDEIEAIGIERARQQLSKAFVVLYLVDVSCTTVTH